MEMKLSMHALHAIHIFACITKERRSSRGGLRAGSLPSLFLSLSPRSIPTNLSGASIYIYMYVCYMCYIYNGYMPPAQEAYQIPPQARLLNRRPSI